MFFLPYIILFLSYNKFQLSLFKDEFQSHQIRMLTLILSILFLLFQAYRQELLEAYECCMKYKRTGKDAELTQV